MASAVEAHWNDVYRRSDCRRSITDEDRKRLEFAVCFFDGVREKRLLDIGCGLGLASRFFAELGADVTAIDVSQVAIDELAVTAKNHGLAQLHPIALDAMAVPSLGQFDLIYGAMVLHHVEPFEDFVECLHRALKPGGRAFFFENNGESNLLMWCRKHLVGRFSIPQQSDPEEAPLRREEIDMLREHFAVSICYPELIFFRMISWYVLRGRALSLLESLDDIIYRLGWLNRHSYLQYIMLERAVDS